MKYRAIIVGAGRIGAGFNWHDDEYTHAGAYLALRERVELVGFVEPDAERATAAEAKWKVPVYQDAGMAPDVEIVSVCTPPERHAEDLIPFIKGKIKGVWMEKPFGLSGEGECPIAIQVNYLRRASKAHQKIANLVDIRCGAPDNQLHVIAKDDIHTRCHFEDLASWWGCDLIYHPFDGPNSYFIRFRTASGAYTEAFFSLGGINGSECMKGMLSNILDHLDNGTPLFSPARTT